MARKTTAALEAWRTAGRASVLLAVGVSAALAAAGAGLGAVPKAPSRSDPPMPAVRRASFSDDQAAVPSQSPRAQMTVGVGEPLSDQSPGVHHRAYRLLNPIVRRVQIRLHGKGYYAGAIDGVLNSETKEALRRYQADHNLEITGTITTEVLYSFDPPPP